MGTKGCLGDEIPQRGRGAQPRWGLKAKPQKPENTFENITDEIDENAQNTVMKWSRLLIMH